MTRANHSASTDQRQTRRERRASIPALLSSMLEGHDLGTIDRLACYPPNYQKSLSRCCAFHNSKFGSNFQMLSIRKALSLTPGNNGSRHLAIRASSPALRPRRCRTSRFTMCCSALRDKPGERQQLQTIVATAAAAMLSGVMILCPLTASAEAVLQCTSEDPVVCVRELLSFCCLHDCPLFQCRHSLSITR